MSDKKRPQRHQRTGKTPETSISAHHREWYRRFMAGERLSDIATDAGVTHTAVGKAVRRIERIASDEFFSEIAHYRARCTVRLEHLYHEAIREWERSKLPAVVDKIGQQANESDDEFDEDAGGYFIERTTKSQTGNPALHGAARDSVSKLMELHGIRYVETLPEIEDDDDIAGLTTVEQVDVQIKKQKGDIKRLTEYREMVAMIEGDSSAAPDATVATEHKPLLETPNEGPTGGPAPD